MGVARNVRKCVGYGTAYAAVYSLVAFAVAASAAPSPLGEAGASGIPQLILAYFAGGIAAGLLIGLLLPLGRTRVGAAAIGFVAAVPVFWALAMTEATSRSMWQVLLQDAIPLGGIMGPAAGLIVRSAFGRSADGGRSSLN